MRPRERVSTVNRSISVRKAIVINGLRPRERVSAVSRTIRYNQRRTSLATEADKCDREVLRQAQLRGRVLWYEYGQ
jgi:hypothetical protein